MAETVAARRFSRFSMAAVVAALSLAAGGGWWWMHRAAASGAEGAASAASGGKGGGRSGAVAVGVAPVVRGDAPQQLSALGTVTASNSAVVRAQITGPLQQVLFHEGDWVRKGQVLAVIDPRPQQAALMQAEGQLQRDQALLANARNDLRRYRELQALNAIATQQVDTQASLVRQYEGTVRLDQGAVATARVNLSYTRVVAPATGRAGLRQVDPGNMVTPSDTNGLVTLTQTQPIHVLFALPEADVERLQQARGAHPGLRAEAWSRDNTQRLAEGTLLAVDNQINTSTGTLSLKARFDNAGNQLFPNQFVNVRLDLGAIPQAVMVPTAAIQMGKVGSYVYRVNADGTVSVQAVTTGPVSGTNTVIAQGLQPGQLVVVDGHDKLRDGARIQRVDRSAQRAAAFSGAGRAGHGGGHRGSAASAPGGGASASGVAAAGTAPGASAARRAASR